MIENTEIISVIFLCCWYLKAGNPDADCKRKSQVRQLIIDSDEFNNYKNDEQVCANFHFYSIMIACRRVSDYAEFKATRELIELQNYSLIGQIDARLAIITLTINCQRWEHLLLSGHNERRGTVLYLMWDTVENKLLERLSEARP